VEPPGEARDAEATEDERRREQEALQDRSRKHLVGQ
jgi:hypothetical protein